MKKYWLCLLFTFSLFTACFSQPNMINSRNEALREMLEKVDENPLINGDSTFKILTAWNEYPSIETNKEYLYVYNDALFGSVPFKIFIPKEYKNAVPATLILLLHGAVGQSHFEDAYRESKKGEDIFFDYLSEKNCIILRPFADPSKKFNWVVNKYQDKANPTFMTLTATINRLKEFLNIDDNKVFAYGHSDGADGAFALDVYSPSLFAGFVCYNSMFTNIFANDIYLHNAVNRKLYIVHSDLDDLRPIQQTRLIVHVLDSIRVPLKYKEYAGFQHYDKHLEKDLPYSNTFITTTERQSFSKKIYWQISNKINASCDWVSIRSCDTEQNKADWQSDLNVLTYDKNKGVYINYWYYRNNPSAAVDASYSNNVFHIAASRVTEVEIRLSPFMQDITKPIEVIMNGKNIYKSYPTYDKNYLLNQFYTSFDRKTLWMNSINVNLN